MAAIINASDVPGFDESDQWRVEDALAMAAQVAPCLAGDQVDEELVPAARAILRRALMRWKDAGSGAVTQVQALSFGQTIDTRTAQSRGLFYPSEVTDLQRLCAGSSRGRAFQIDTSPTTDPSRPLGVQVEL